MRGAVMANSNQQTDAPSPADAAQRWVLPVAILGSSLGFIDSSVVNVALPAIQTDLGAALSTTQWISNGYVLSLASFILLGGSLGDRYGTLRAFAAGLIVFVLSSAICGLAGSSTLLILARFLQGAGAAVLVPTSLALISQAYAGESRGKAIGTWAGAGGVLMALGPPLGGWLVDHAGWRWIFFINLPVGALALALATKIRGSQSGNGARPLDLAGSVLAVAFLGLSAYGLMRIGEGEPGQGGAALAASLVFGLVFLRAEQRSAHPLLPLRLFRNRNFSGANALTVVLYGGLGGALFILPFHLINVHAYSATAAGTALLPFSIILGLGSRAAGGLAGAVGPRLPMTAGPALTALGFALLALSAGQAGYWWGYFPGLTLVGFGMTVTIPPLTTIVFDSAPEEDSGAASGINNAAARSGSLIAVAALGIAFGGANMAGLSPGELSSAYATVMAFAALAAAASALLAWAVISPRPVRAKP